MNILFITHDVGLYGASRSLGLSIKSLLENTDITKDNIHLVYNVFNFRMLRNIFSGKKDKRFILNNYLRGLRNIYTGIFPFSLSYKGRPETRIHDIGSIALLLLFPFYWFFRGKTIIKNHNISHVHLNSLVLWPLLILVPRKIKKIIHIREIHDNTIFRIFSRIKIKTIKKYADTIIAIDSSTANSFIDSPKLKIIRNPFDMSIVSKRRAEKQKILREYKIPTGRNNVTLIGSLSENKGQDFFLDIANSFSDTKMFNFLIVGKVDIKSSKIIEKKVSKIRNAFYLGEVEEIGDIYAISETIMRCEEYYKTGRTVWEALYAGCSNIMIPVKNSTKIKECVPEDEFRERFTYYTARDLNDVMNKLLNTRHRKIPSSDVNNNLKEFSSKFYNAIKI
ncbi:MAG: hypothetical protein KAS21_02440 [Candidatus Aminicenantes bacterium]|nr:hypothetical protein [Candidatus Aminicenantes bacterium]